MATCHRWHLDAFLESATPVMTGDVLDIGGQRSNKKGRFRPPTAGVTSWRYVNISVEAEPDILCDAGTIPLPDASIDCVLLCEVLEHVVHPDAVLREAARLLKPGGRGVISMPFMYPVHADPHDFQRWTADRFRVELGWAGLTVERIEPLGGPFAAVHDMLNNVVWRSEPRRALALLGKALHRTTGLARAIDRRLPESWIHITSGWGAVVGRPLL